MLGSRPFDEPGFGRGQGLKLPFCRNPTVILKPCCKNIPMLHLSTGIAPQNKVHATTEWGAVNGIEMGSLMKKFVIVMVSTIGVAGAAVAADMPVRQPPPPPPLVGKAPIGKAPIGKAPIGKAPVVAPAPPIVTRG